MWNYINKMKVLKHFFLLPFVISFFLNTSLFSFEQNRKQVIANVQKIEYLSQKIAKDYLYLLQNPKLEALNGELKSSITQIENSFRFIAKNSKNSDAKDILNFLSYSKDQIKDTLEKKMSRENALTILDSTQSLYEGSRSILSTYNYNLWSDIDVKIAMMKILKLYMAIHLDINSDINRELMQNEMDQIEKRLEISSMSLNRTWQALKEYLKADKDYFVPNIIYILTKQIEKAKR